MVVLEVFLPSGCVLWAPTAPTVAIAVCHLLQHNHLHLRTCHLHQRLQQIRWMIPVSAAMTARVDLFLMAIVMMVALAMSSSRVNSAQIVWTVGLAAEIKDAFHHHHRQHPFFFTPEYAIIRVALLEIFTVMMEVQEVSFLTFVILEPTVKTVGTEAVIPLYHLRQLLLHHPLHPTRPLSRPLHPLLATISPSPLIKSCTKQSCNTRQTQLRLFI